MYPTFCSYKSLGIALLLNKILLIELMKKLNNKVALITGGNSGIGLVTAELFASEGAKVTITGRDEETLQKSADQIGSEALAIKADILNLATLGQAYQESTCYLRVMWKLLFTTGWGYPKSR